MKRISLAAIAAILLVSCGKKTNEKTSAPRRESESGIIASCSTRAEAEELSQKLGISFRIINEKRKLVEYIGISAAELKRHLPRSNFKKNKIFNDVLVSGNFQGSFFGNDEYYGAHPAEYRTEAVARQFPHLNQIETFSATNMGEGSIIAVVDTGVYYNHPHLSPNIYVNPNDKHGSQANGQDDDGNGFRDDFAGWDFYNGDAYPIDDHGHGTHVAGLAASTHSGIAPKAKILPVKVLSADGRGDLGTIAAGILYAIDRGAHIINLSLGGEGGGGITREIRQLIDTVKLAKQNNVLIVAAAGNGGMDGLGDCNDKLPVYPANIDEDNVISVASVDEYDNLTEYSNFGGATVHIAAPGGDYYTGGLNSTAIPQCNGPCSRFNTPYVSQMGTSMATPVVAGVAALVRAQDQSRSYLEIRDKILKNGKEYPDLLGLIQSASVVNVRQALE